MESSFEQEIWTLVLEKLSSLSRGLFTHQAQLIKMGGPDWVEVRLRSAPLFKIALGKREELEKAFSAVLKRPIIVKLTPPKPETPPVEPVKTIFELAAEGKLLESKPPTSQSIEVFALYADLSEPEVWKLWENQIRLAVLAAYTRARETAGKATLFPLEIVGELSVTLRQGGEVIRVEFPAPPPPIDLPQETPAKRGRVKQYDLPPPPPGARIVNGDFIFWFGTHEGKKLSSLLSLEGLQYCHWLRQQKALPSEYRTAVNQHIKSANTARKLARYDHNRYRFEQ